MSEPPLVHLLQKLLGDGIAGGGGVAVRAEGSGLLARDVIHGF